MSYPHRPATLSMIAKKAKVSISCVSRILSGKKLENFTPATIQSVHRIAKELHYRPNRLVHGMRTGMTGTIGVIINSNNPFYGSVVEGIHDYLSAKDRVPIVVWSKVDAQKNGRTELELIHSLIDRRVEGIILKPTFDSATDEYFREILDRNIPLVTVDRALPNANCSYVGSNDQRGVEAALHHLKQLGHRKIAYFGPETDVSTGASRIEAFRFWMKKNPEIKGGYCLTQDWEPTPEEILSYFKKFHSSTAVLCVSDLFAWGLYEEAAVQKIRIPEDLSIVGYGDLLRSRFISPPMTTVDQHPYEIGEIAAERVISRIENPSNRFSNEFVGVDLVIRQSTAKPRGNS